MFLHPKERTPMVTEARKLQLIEEVLKIKNEATLAALEDFMSKAKGNELLSKKKIGFEEFSGVWTAEEATEIEGIIKESYETIHPDDWK